MADLKKKKIQEQHKGISEDTEKYFASLGERIEKNYLVGRKARELGLDPSDRVEAPLALTMAAKVVRLVSSVYPQLDREDIINRLLELEEKYGALENSVSFQIAREIAEEKFCKFENKLEAMDAGIRVGFAYTTLGVVSSPIEGFTGIQEGERKDGKKYIKAFFSGPIRSAGTTASCVVVMLIDYIRQLFGYERYDPDEKECKRLVTELLDYHERVTNLQYCPSEEEAMFIAKNLPIQICGDPTSKREVSNYKDLLRVETNFIRGGLCLIVGEGVAQKASKGLRILKGIKKNGFEMRDWEWFDKYVELHEKQTVGKAGDSGPTYIKDLVAGRPVFGHPQQGFRFRYGRSRGAGFSAVSLHPATMAVSENFIASGTQLKIEKPTKGCAVTPCDSIEGPIVKFENESVKQLEDYEEAEMMNSKIKEIIYAGDILFPLGDVMNRNAVLPRPGYVEEWWYLELLKKEKSFEGMDYMNIGLDKAKELSKKYKVSLYPKYIYYWTQIDYELFLGLIDWLSHSRISEGKLLFPYNQSERERFQKGKRALELLGVQHEVSVENVVLDKLETEVLLLNLGTDTEKFSEGLKEYLDKVKKEGESLNDRKNNLDWIVLRIINKLSSCDIRDKAGEFIGSRMGRPEKAKLRKLTGSPNALFPVSNEGGRLRSVNEAVKVGSVKSEFPFNYCENCKRETIYRRCEVCGGKTKEKYYCKRCKSEVKDRCEIHGLKERSKFTRIDMNHYYEAARGRLGYLKTDVPELIKGVRGTSSKGHNLERLEKGILRAKYNLTVNKDGTIRYDMTELPLTHFKPKEIGTSVEKLKELGYEKDYKGRELKDENQILEMKPHDILLPCNDKAGDERADDVFMNIANFLDEMLEKLYGLPRFYNIEKREDLVGVLGVTMAPHNCAGVICRIIGFSKVQGLVGTPYLHAAMRRDCVYPSTKFVYSENNFIKNSSIGYFVENLIKQGNSKRQIDGYGTERIELSDKEKNLYAYGVNPETKRLVKKKIKYFIKGKPPEKWIKMKTTTGREQIMTPRHKFVYLDDENNFQIKQADEIKKGDKLALLKNFKLPKKEIKKIFLPKILTENIPLKKQNEIRIVNAGDFFKKIVKEYGEKKIRELLGIVHNHLNKWYNIVPIHHVKKLVDEDLIRWEDLPKKTKIRTIFNIKEWDLNLDVSNDLMSILGYYSAEGYCRQTKTVSQVCFRIMDKEQKNKLVSAVRNSFSLDCSLGENETKVTICNKLIYYLFKYCFKLGSNAYLKQVPDLLYNVSKKFVKEYLSCYFDGDGTIIKGKRNFVCFYSVNKELLDGIALLCEKLGIFGRFSKTKERLPGKKILERYAESGKIPKTHILFHLTYSGKDFYKIIQALKPVSKSKSKKIKNTKIKMAKNRKIRFENKYFDLEKAGDIVVDKVKEVEIIKDKKPSYCFEIDWKSDEDKNVLWGEQIINFRCDGDEAGIMMLLDVLINFSQKFLPSHRGGTQDAPLVLNGKIFAKEVDDQILDFELCNIYPLELYEKAERKEHSGDIKIDNVQERLKKEEDPYVDTGFTHGVSDINMGPTCSSYKLLPTMKDKVETQMRLCCKLRGVDQGDVARLIIDRHFMRDLKGNLRKFSQQNFRCSKCNKIYRRPPLKGKCENCGGNIIFTISYGSIVKYLEPALDLTENFNVPIYITQDLKLTKRYIESIFGKDNEKQESINKWF